MESIVEKNGLEISLLYKMILIRVFENEISRRKMQREIYGMAHCACGQEAVAVGLCSALQKEDYVVSTHRPHGHAIAKGVDIKKIAAEIMGKGVGTNNGKGGSMHIVDPELGLIMSTGIVGSGIPVACGAAFSAKYKKDGKVACVFFGDGAANEGVFHECLNISAVWKLPIIFVLEDNGLAVTTKTKNTSACLDYIALASAYGIKGELVDGQDIENVHKAAKESVMYVKSKGLPILIQAKTIRFNEHAEGEYYWEIRKTGYRSLEKLEEDKISRCPIRIYSNKLIERKLITEKNLKELEERAYMEVQESFDYATQAAEPEIGKAFQDVYKGRE
ncbi:MAG: thiamine pyrophosphate-dependent dehydrogenase E1 component subunit alpha [Lachnospiraceae bacterium]|nr:thiamine pyrophosphate-dependent dehydrogenase E1 component subunit alpha [Lachnospiraceae bacterium]